MVTKAGRLFREPDSITPCLAGFDAAGRPTLAERVCKNDFSAAGAAAGGRRPSIHVAIAVRPLPRRPWPPLESTSTAPPEACEASHGPQGLAGGRPESEAVPHACTMATGAEASLRESLERLGRRRVFGLRLHDPNDNSLNRRGMAGFVDEVAQAPGPDSEIRMLTCTCTCSRAHAHARAHDCACPSSTASSVSSISSPIGTGMRLCMPQALGEEGGHDGEGMCSALRRLRDEGTVAHVGLGMNCNCEAHQGVPGEVMRLLRQVQIT